MDAEAKSNHAKNEEPKHNADGSAYRNWWQRALLHLASLTVQSCRTPKLSERRRQTGSGGGGRCELASSVGRSSGAVRLDRVVRHHSSSLRMRDGDRLRSSTRQTTTTPPSSRR